MDVGVASSGLGSVRRFCRGGASRPRRAVVACVLLVGLVPVVDVSGVAAQSSPADGCVGELGALDAATSYVTARGIIALDASCVSSQRNPGSSSTYYARRHVFTLAAPATITISHNGSSSGAYVVLLEGRSVDGSGTVVGRADGGSRYDAARLDDLLLAAGTYTIEATTRSAEATGNYTVAVNWNPADGCVGELGALDAATSYVTARGIIALDASCVSSQRNPGSSSTYYARRHVHPRRAGDDHDQPQREQFGRLCGVVGGAQRRRIGDGGGPRRRRLALRRREVG